MLFKTYKLILIYSAVVFGCILAKVFMFLQYIPGTHAYTPVQYHVPMMPVPAGTPDALQVGSWVGSLSCYLSTY